MKSTSVTSLLLGFVAPVLGAPAATTTTCRANQMMVSKLKACASASSVCSQYLTASTQVFTSTVTLSQKTSTKTVSATESVWTETDTVYPSSWVTESTTYTATSYTTKASCPALKQEKRTAATPNPTAAPKPGCKIAPDSEPSVISSACNCALGSTISTTKTTTQGVGGTTTLTTTSTLVTTMPGVLTTTSTLTTTVTSTTSATACATPPHCSYFYMKTTETRDLYSENTFLHVDGYLAQGYGEAYTTGGTWTASTFAIDAQNHLYCPTCYPSSSFAYINEPMNKDNSIKFMPWDQLHNSTSGQKKQVTCLLSPDGVMSCSAGNNNVMYLTYSGGLSIDIAVPPGPEEYPNYPVKIRQKCA